MPPPKTVVVLRSPSSLGSNSELVMPRKRKRDTDLTIPRLPMRPSRNDFQHWEGKMRALLESRGLWQVVSGATLCPKNPYDGVRNLPGAISEEDNQMKLKTYHDYREWIHADVEAADIILNGLNKEPDPVDGDEASSYHYSKLTSSTALYDAILAEYKPGNTSLATRMDRYKKWVETKYPYTESYYEYYHEALAEWEQLLEWALACGCDISEEMQIFVLIEAFKGRYPSWASELRHKMRKIDKPLRVSECISALKLSMHSDRDIPKAVEDQREARLKWEAEVGAFKEHIEGDIDPAM